MRTSQMSDKELSKEIQRLYKNVSRRISRIEKRQNTASQTATSKFYLFKEKFPYTLKEYNRKEKEKIYNTLRTINDLKTSTVKGAIKQKQNFEKVDRAFQGLNNEQKEIAREIINDLLDNNKLLKGFKYDVMSVVAAQIRNNITPEEIFQNINYLYDEATMESADIDEDIDDIFLSKLDEFKFELM